MVFYFTLNYLCLTFNDHSLPFKLQLFCKWNCKKYYLNIIWLCFLFGHNHPISQICDGILKQCQYVICRFPILDLFWSQKFDLASKFSPFCIIFNVFSIPFGIPSQRSKWPSKKKLVFVSVFTFILSVHVSFLTQNIFSCQNYLASIISTN